jgi:hypothetical protein
MVASVGTDIHSGFKQVALVLAQVDEHCVCHKGAALAAGCQFLLPVLAVEEGDGVLDQVRWPLLDSACSRWQLSVVQKAGTGLPCENCPWRTEQYLRLPSL